MDKRPHKAYVDVSESTWREFKALGVERGQTIPERLGELVERDVENTKREKVRTIRRAEARRREGN